MRDFSTTGKLRSVLQRDFFVGWAKAAALPTEKCGFTTTVGQIEPLPTLRRNSIQPHFSL